jgi:glutaredoxin
MSLLFKLNEWLNNAGVDFDTADLMEHAIQARNKMIKWANVLTNLMHFSLCFGFVAMICASQIVISPAVILMRWWCNDVGLLPTLS